ncbi:MAG TPA: nickel pincer cofactor biosynthesis protein LarB [Burkholderiales bacterium]|nr:nickel pincer cofactor biosynthesis protein LarB [Burkholderiales bacterium]
MSARDIRLDRQRRARVGLDEAVLCASKSIEQIVTILDQTSVGGGPLLLTRLSEQQFRSLPDHHQSSVDYDPVSRTGICRGEPLYDGESRVAIVTAGSSDVPAGREAARTLAYYRYAADEICDVGVAGLWRLLEHVETLRHKAAVIVAAGMDGALPSVVAGLLPGVVIALPTSVGYGVGQGGHAALNTALSSCAPGLVVVNIDNGYGAACAAVRVLRQCNSSGPE